MGKMKKWVKSLIEFFVRELKWRSINEERKQKSPYLSTEALPKR